MRLASKLRDELYRWAQENDTRIPEARDVIPFVKECVFLHHPDFRCALLQNSRIDLFGFDDHESEHGLSGISARLLEPPGQGQRVHEQILVELLARIGLVQRRRREIQSWMIDEEPLGEGEGWQEWPAFHRVVTARRARIRFLVTPPGSTKQEQTSLPNGAPLSGHEAGGREPVMRSLFYRRRPACSDGPQSNVGRNARRASIAELQSRLDQVARPMGDGE